MIVLMLTGLVLIGAGLLDAFLMISRWAILHGRPVLDRVSGISSPDILIPILLVGLGSTIFIFSQLSYFDKSTDVIVSI